MSAGQKRSTAFRASLADDFPEDFDSDEDVQTSRRRGGVGASLDADDMELIAGGAKKRKQSATSSGAKPGRPRASTSGKPPSSKKPRRSLLSDNEDEDDPAAVDDDAMDVDGDASDAKRARAIAARARAAAASETATALGSMSKVAAAAHATHLDYFSQLSAPAKSKNTLKDVVKLTAEQRANIAAALPVRHSGEKARLLACHKSAMREWYFQLRSGGFNLLAYGFGSKKQLLSDFAKSWLTDGPVVVLNGYYPGANVKNVSSYKQ